MPRRQCLLISLLIILLIPGSALAQVPEMVESEISNRATEDVSILICPARDGNHFTQAYRFGGVPMDATIEIILRDAMGNPYPGIQFMDIWLEGQGLNFCQDGNTADFNTDPNGYTEFANPLRGGGCSEYPSLVGYVMGMPFLQPPQPYIKVNSPDMNGDLIINLADVAMFSSAFFSGYSYCADYFWDGILNLSDVAILSQHVGHSCP